MRLSKNGKDWISLSIPQVFECVGLVTDYFSQVFSMRAICSRCGRRIMTTLWILISDQRSRRFRCSDPISSSLKDALLTFLAW